MTIFNRWLFNPKDNLPISATPPIVVHLAWHKYVSSAHGFISSIQSPSRYRSSTQLNSCNQQQTADTAGKFDCFQLFSRGRASLFPALLLLLCTLTKSKRLHSQLGHNLNEFHPFCLHKSVVSIISCTLSGGKYRNLLTNAMHINLHTE